MIVWGKLIPPLFFVFAQYKCNPFNAVARCKMDNTCLHQLMMSCATLIDQILMSIAMQIQNEPNHNYFHGSPGCKF